MEYAPRAFRRNNGTCGIKEIELKQSASYPVCSKIPQATVPCDLDFKVCPSDH